MTGPVVEQNFIKLAQGIALVLVDKFADSVERICCVGEGRKLEILKKNPAVCLELDGRGELVEAANPCAYGYTFASVIGTGNVEFIEYTEEKIYALNRIMKHQAGIEAPFTASMADAVCLYKMTTNDFTCKIRAK